MKYEREPLAYRKAEERINDWKEVLSDARPDVLLKTQAARCMDCGTPFCHQVKSLRHLKNKIYAIVDIVYNVYHVLSAGDKWLPPG